MSRRQTGTGTIAALALTCVFGATLLLSLAAGAGVYRRVADRVERSAGDRVGLTYITAKIHSYDEAGMVSSGRIASGQPGGGEASAVYLCQEIDGVVYQTALYVYDGYLRELLCEKEWPLGAEAGLPITEAQELLVEEPEPGLLHLTYIGADGTASTADVHLRSGGEQMEERIRPTKSGLFAIELLIAVGIFSLCAAICVGLFVRSEVMSQDAADLNRAVSAARSAAECYKAAGGDLERTAQLTGGKVLDLGPGALFVEFDEDWQILPPGEVGAFELTIAPDQTADGQDMGYTGALLEVKRYSGSGSETVGEGILMWSIAALEVAP